MTITVDFPFKYSVILLYFFNIRLKKVIEHEPDNELAYYNLGMLSMDDHNMKDAEHWLKKALEVG